MANKDKIFSRLIPVTMTVLALAVLWFYWPVLAQLFGDLAENEDYSFGLLLPLVSGYIVYLKLPQIRSYLWRPSWLRPCSCSSATPWAASTNPSTSSPSMTRWRRST